MDTELIERTLNILHLEDNANDHLLVTETLRADGLHCEFTLAKNEGEFAKALNDHKFDLIISDHTLPSYDGLRALTTAQLLHAKVPFIFFSGTIGEEVAVESLRNGAVDYILKQRPHRLIAAVRRAIRNALERERLERTQKSLKQTEERLRIVARATNDVIWEWDLQNDRLWFSENFQTAFGREMPPGGLSSKEWFEFIHPDDRQTVLSSLSALLAGGGRVWWSEHRVRHENGSYVFIYDRASINYETSGKPARMVGIKIDVTERKQAEEKIREQADLLDKTSDAIVVCSLDRKITGWNKSAERIYGWTSREVIGRHIHELFFPQGVPPEMREKAGALEQTGEWMAELQEATKSGTPVTVQSRCTLIRDAAGEPKSLLIVNTDITKHKQLEDQLLRAQRMESLAMLVSGIAHDLNNMLVPVLLGVEILAMENLSPDARSMVQTMDTSTRRSAEMIRQMLLFARGGQAVKTVIQVNQLVREIGRLVKDTFPKNIACTIGAEQKVHPISGIATQIHQVLMNLCVNARDAMPEGGSLALTVGNVHLAAEEAALMAKGRIGDFVCITVQDTGAGIPPEKLEKIFLPFFTTKAPGKGTGLGLSTCQNIVKNHNGFMTVYSELNEGTEFKVYLPIATTETDAETPPQLPTGKGERILIIDDEESILALARTTLENYGYRVSTAASGIEALARFREDPAAIRLVMVDQTMPFMDGPAIAAALRRIRSDIKVIITGDADAPEAGPEGIPKTDGFVLKPFTTEKLLTIIHEALSK